MKNLRKQKGYALLLTLAVSVMALSLTVFAFDSNQREIDTKERALTVDGSAQVLSDILQANLQAVSGLGWLPNGTVTADELRDRNALGPVGTDILGQQVVSLYAPAVDDPERIDLLITTSGAPNPGLLSKYGWDGHYEGFIRGVLGSEALYLSPGDEPTGAVAGEISDGVLHTTTDQEVDLSAFRGMLDGRNRVGVYVRAPKQVVEWTFFFGYKRSSYEPEASSTGENLEISYASFNSPVNNAGARLFCPEHLARVRIDETTEWRELPADSPGLCLESLIGDVDTDLVAKTSFQFLTAGSALSPQSPEPYGSTPSVWGNHCYITAGAYSRYPFQGEVSCFDRSDVLSMVNPNTVEGLVASRIDSNQIASNAGLGHLYDDRYKAGAVTKARTIDLNDYVNEEQRGHSKKRTVVDILHVDDKGILSYRYRIPNGSLGVESVPLLPENYYGYLCAEHSINFRQQNGKWIADVSCTSQRDNKQDFVVPSYLYAQTVVKELSEGRYLYIYNVDGQFTTGADVQGFNRAGYRVGERGRSSVAINVPYQTGDGTAEMTIQVLLR
ncbi:hypothetical protein [Salinicola rhizosphaerae]|uniref:Uncharacterized protein n=1 Tax=Salinicola rhizosphaerae TaxID=1443141 RepID=A0ABQ3DU22_9GAMM|nr:hypothetical protein [Salinicola rhizosphaerae]GHB12984.1 hypothetical protein GCM10009038_08800 [Salinicola rhizosphaerae]